MMCSKRLIRLIRDNITSIAAYPPFHVTAEIEEKLTEFHLPFRDECIRQGTCFSSSPLAGGFLVDSMFEPFMTDKSNTVLNQLFGTGKGSGAAFLFAVIGVMGVLVCVVFSWLKAMRALED